MSSGDDYDMGFKSRDLQHQVISYDLSSLQT